VSRAADDEDDDAAGKHAARYRKVEVRTWSDKRFRELSRMPPSAQGLWLYLLTGPHTTLMPGLFDIGRAGLAERLHWSLTDFDRCFAELERIEMAFADWDAGVVWLPNALRHNPPANPNIIVRWGADIELVPECVLRRRALEALERHVTGRSAKFIEAFEREFGAVLARCRELEAEDAVRGIAHGCGNGSGNGSANGSRNQDQEQYQEQKQEQEQKQNASASRSRRTRVARASRAPAQGRAGFDPLALALPAWLPLPLWQLWVEHRREIRKPLTKKGAELTLKKLAAFRANGVDAKTAIENSIEARWTGLFEPARPPRRGATAARSPPQEALLAANRAVAATWSGQTAGPETTPLPEDDPP
jgi:hypothetical protein